MKYAMWIYLFLQLVLLVAFAQVGESLIDHMPEAPKEREVQCNKIA